MFENRSELALPVESWLTKEDAFIGLGLSSFVINMLGLVFPVCVLQFYDRVIPHKSAGTLTLMICLILVCLVLETVFKIMRAYVSSWASARFTYNMGRKLFHRLIYTDLTSFEQKTAGSYLDKFNSAESIREYYCGQNLIMLIDLPFALIYLVLIFFISKYMLVMPVLVILVMFALAAMTTEKTHEKLQNKISMAEVKDKFLVEMITGIHTIKALGMEEQFMRRYERLHQKEIANNYELIQRVSESERSGNLFSQLAVVFSVSLGGILVMKHALTVGGLAASILLIGKIMPPMTKVVSYMERKNNLAIAMEDMKTIMSLQPECAENLRQLTNFSGDINFQGVSFRYEPNSKAVLQDINLHIKANETIVLHGDEGSGKTSLLQLMSSLISSTTGTILIDGQDMKQVDLESYRRKIAFMTDGGELFSGTIMDNLTLFESDRYSDQAIAISKEIGLHDIIEKMPNAYNSEVGTGTVDLLSKGNKQQILIVRSLLNNPGLLLFDEANVSLDIDSDVKLRKFLASKKGKCTIVLVTHRPSLLEMADKHYKLEAGKLVDFKWK